MTRTSLRLAAFAAVPFAVILALGGPADAETVALTVGQTRTVAAETAIGRIVIGEPGVVTARLKSAREVELTAAAAGRTEVRLEVVGGGAAAEFDIQVATQGDREVEALRERVRDAPGLGGVTVERRGERLVLSGEVKDLETHARMSGLVTANAGERAVSDLVAVTGAQMVAVDVRFYAISASTLRALGFNFTDVGGSIQGGTFAPSSLDRFALQPGGLDITSGVALQNAFNILLSKPRAGVLGVMSALSGAGLSQVLAQPTLLARSGESADFLAGGDVPIPVPQGGFSNGGITIEYKPYGVRLSVTPIVLSDRRIQLKLAPEVSELDYSNQVTVQGVGVPAFRRRSAATTVELGDGQSFVIAGLTYMTGNSQEGRVPGLGDLPILGTLFKTSQTTRERQELIIVATPHLVNPLEKDPLEGVALDPAHPSLGDRLLNKDTLAAPLQRFGLSR